MEMAALEAAKLCGTILGPHEYRFVLIVSNGKELFKLHNNSQESANELIQVSYTAQLRDAFVHQGKVNNVDDETAH